MSVEQKSNENKNYFWFHYNILYIFGVPIKDFQNAYWRKVYNVYAVCVVMVFFYMYCTFEATHWIQHWDDLNSFTFTLSYLLSHVLGCIKLTLVLIYRNNIHNYCQSLSSGVFLPNIDRSGIEEFQFVERATKTANRLASTFHILVIPIVSQRALYAILDGGHYEEVYDLKTNASIQRHIRLLPYTSWLPFEAVDSPFYEIGFIYQILSLAFFGFMIGACDAIIYGILCHIKAQFLILRNSLHTFLERAAYLMKEDGYDIDIKKYTEFKVLENGIHIVEKISMDLQKYVDICITDCVKHHIQIIELAKQAEETFSYLMLVQFLFSLMLICFQLFQLSLYKVASFKFFSMICYLALMLFQLLIFCWNGNEVMLVSKDLMNDVFNSNWIVTDVSTQKSLILMMCRAYRPIKISAGKFTFLILETFMTIIRGSGSYFMVLRNMNKRKRITA